MKKNFIKLFSSLSILLLSIGVSGCFGSQPSGDSSGSNASQEDGNAIVLCNFEEWNEDYKALKLSNNFGKVSRSSTHANGNYSMKIQPLGAYSYQDNPVMCIPTYSNFYEFAYNNFSYTKSVTFTIYNAQDVEQVITFGLVKTLDSQTCLKGVKYTLQPGINEIKYDVSDTVVPYTTDITNIEGLYFRFDNAGSRSLDDAPVFYLDDVKLVQTEEPKLFLDAPGVGTRGKEFTLPEFKVYGAGENFEVEKKLYCLSGGGKTEVAVSEGTFVPENVGNYEYIISVITENGIKTSSSKEIFVDDVPAYNLVESFNDTTAYEFKWIPHGNPVLYRSTVSTITVGGEEKTEVDGQSPNGVMLKLECENVKDWGEGVSTRLAGEALDEAFEKFDYVSVRFYIDHGTNVKGGKGYTELYISTVKDDGLIDSSKPNMTIASPKKNGWGTAIITKEMWTPGMSLMVRNAWGVDLSSFTVYLDEIVGGYNDVLVTGQSHFNDDANVKFSSYTNYLDVETSIVETIPTATAEELSQIQGKMLKISFPSTMYLEPVYGANGVLTSLDKTSMDVLASNYDKILIRMYVETTDELTDENLTFYFGHGYNGTYLKYGTPVVNINRSGWWTIEISSSDWLNETAPCIWLRNFSELDINFYIDEIYGENEDGSEPSFESINIIEKTGLTVEQLEGTYFETNDGTKTVLTAAQLVDYAPTGAGKIVLIIKVEGFTAALVEILVG